MTLIPPSLESEREEREMQAVDDFAEKIGHEACMYTLKATTYEIAMHLLLVDQAGGPVPACGVDA